MYYDEHKLCLLERGGLRLSRESTRYIWVMRVPHWWDMVYEVNLQADKVSQNSGLYPTGTWTGVPVLWSSQLAQCTQWETVLENSGANQAFLIFSYLPPMLGHRKQMRDRITLQGKSWWTRWRKPSPVPSGLFGILGLPLQLTACSKKSELH